jgi:riboflavin synthase
MFTGIVQALGTVVGLKKGRLEVRGKLSGLKKGDSVAVNGVCLTLIGPAKAGRMAFDASRETLDKTTLGGLKAGEKVNLEPALRVGDRLGGHFVQGHVEGSGKVLASTPADEKTLIMEFSVPLALKRYLAPKGSVTVDGVSLTVVDVKEHSFTAAVVPHTAENTTLGGKKPGDAVNLESDLLARHLESLLDAGKDDPGGLFVKKDVSWDALMAEEGYK